VVTFSHCLLRVSLGARCFSAGVVSAIPAPYRVYDIYRKTVFSASTIVTERLVRARRKETLRGCAVVRVALPAAIARVTVFGRDVLRSFSLG